MPRHINLLDRVQQKTSPRMMAVYMVAPIAICILSLSSWGTVLHFKLRNLKIKLDAIEAEIRPLDNQLTQIQTSSDAEQTNLNLKQQIAQLSTQLKARESIQLALKQGDLGRTQGYSEYLRSLAKQTPAEIWLTRLDLDRGGRDIIITGRSYRPEYIASFLRRLHAEPILVGQQIASLSINPSDQEDLGTSLPTGVLRTNLSANPLYEFSLSSVPSTPVATSATSSQAASPAAGPSSPEAK